MAADNEDNEVDGDGATARQRNGRRRDGQLWRRRRLWRWAMDDDDDGNGATGNEVDDDGDGVTGDDDDMATGDNEDDDNDGATTMTTTTRTTTTTTTEVLNWMARILHPNLWILMGDLSMRTRVFTITIVAMDIAATVVLNRSPFRI